MKNYLLGILLVAATSIASAQVTVYGKMRMYAESVQEGTLSSETRLSNDNSRLGFRATEDLGNGLRATAVIETLINADSPASSADTKFGNRTSTVGLNNSFGSIRLGRTLHTYAVEVANFSPIIDYGSLNNIIHKQPAVRFDNGIYTHISNSSFTARYDYGVAESPSVDNHRTASLSTNFGLVTATVASYKTGNTDHVAIGLKTSIGSAKISTLWTKKETTGLLSENGKSVTVFLPVSNSRVTTFASVGSNNDKTDAYSIGTSYNFSKNTLAHIIYSNHKTASAATNKKMFGFGLEHNF
jgi:predicted porin